MQIKIEEKFVSYEMIVGLQVKDDKLYSDYRHAMKPLLEKADGGFRYDFKVSEVLKNEEGRPINRVFAIYFGSKEQSERFFSDPGYLEIKKQFFEASVDHTNIISKYECS